MTPAMQPSDVGAWNRGQVLWALGFYGAMRSEDLAKRLGLSPKTTRAHLRALRDSGEVDRVGHKYRLADAKPKAKK